MEVAKACAVGVATAAAALRNLSGLHFDARASNAGCVRGVRGGIATEAYQSSPLPLSLEMEYCRVCSLHFAT
jgi:hypothetical protein